MAQRSYSEPSGNWSPTTDSGSFGCDSKYRGVPDRLETAIAGKNGQIEHNEMVAAAFKLVIVAILISFAALLASEWFARRAAARLHGS